MRAKHKKRLWFVLFFVAVVTSASALILSSLNDNLLYFYTPSELIEKPTSINQKIKLGGLVQTGSVLKSEDLKVRFELTDLKESIEVQYQGILPDLFREMQGVIVNGRFVNHIFIAESVLAKHDENYMPAEVAKKLGYIKQPNQKNEASEVSRGVFNYLENQSISK